jgi:hypothetical protein
MESNQDDKIRIDEQGEQTEGLDKDICHENCKLGGTNMNYHHSLMLWRKLLREDRDGNPKES